MTSTLFRATEDGVNTSLGGWLASGDDYEPPLDDDGKRHPEDQAHINAGRLLEATKHPDLTAPQIRERLLALDPPIDPPANTKKSELLDLLSANTEA